MRFNIIQKIKFEKRVTISLNPESKQTDNKINVEYEMKNNMIGRKFLMIAGTLAFLASVAYAGDLRILKEKSFQMKDWENIFVDASGASINVESWEKQEVYVKIYGNERAEQKLKYDIYQDGPVVKVIIKRKSSFFNWSWGNISVRVVAKVPKNFNPHLETSGGDIEVKNVTGGFKFDTSGGDIAGLNLNGKLHAETSGGDIHLENHKGFMNVSTSGGDIECKNVIGDLKAETSGGDIDIDVKDGRIECETSGGDIRILYSGENKGIEGSTSGGTIRAKLPGDFKANAHLETSGGDIENNFTNTRASKVKRSELIAEYNGGGPVLHLETSGGDIIVDQK